jgi:hypothetical protein
MKPVAILQNLAILAPIPWVTELFLPKINLAACCHTHDALMHLS